MELPPYRLPMLRSVVARMMERSGLYLRKAGTIILGISLLMWVITSYPKLDTLRGGGATASAGTGVITAAEMETLIVVVVVCVGVGLLLPHVLRSSRQKASSGSGGPCSGCNQGPPDKERGDKCQHGGRV